MSRTRALGVRGGRQHSSVSMNRVAKQLRREALANPKKAIVLGLLLAVGLWFWIPLVGSWIWPDDPSAEGTAVASVAQPPPLPAPMASRAQGPPDEVQVPRHPWRQLVQWIHSDPRTQPAGIPPEGRDPFVIPGSQLVEVPSVEDPDGPIVPPDVAPESLGMVLSSTIIGPGRRMARIDGKLYRQGDPVAHQKDGRPIRFLLAEVHSRQVILQRNGERFELKTPSAPRAGTIEVFRNEN